MKLSGRNLELNTQGDDVKLLHWELMLLHQSSPSEYPPIAENEIGKSIFGPSTKKAISQLQWKLTGNEFGDGVVTDELAGQINAAVGQLPPFRIWVEVEDETTGERLAGRTAHLLHVRNTDEDTLAIAVTDTEGTAELTYDVKALTSGKGRPAILVRILAADGRLLATSPTREYPGPEERFHFTVRQDAGDDVWRVHVEVRSTRTGGPLEGIIVRAFDWDIGGEDLLGEGQSDASGRVTIEYNEESFRKTSNEVDGPDLIVRAYNDDGQLLATSTRRMNAGRDETVVLQIAEGEVSHVVRGRIRNLQGQALRGLTVRAIDRDLRQEQVLGAARSDDAGEYRIKYDASSVLRAEHGTADLAVAVLDESGQAIAARAEDESGQPIPTFALRDGAAEGTTEVQVLINAPAEAVINLVVTDARVRGVSEYERHHKTLTSVLGKTPIAEVLDGELAFLAAETAIPLDHLNLLRAAERLASQSKIEPSVFYGLFRQGLGSTLTQLLAHTPAERRRALVASVQAEIIPALDDDELGRKLAQLEELLSAHVAGETPVAEDSRVGDLLAATVPDTAVRAIFVRAYAAYDGRDAQEFWRTVAAMPEIGPERAQDLRVTFHLDRLSGGHLPLIKAVQAERRAGKLRKPEDLVQLDEAGWVKLIDSLVDDAPVGVPAGVPGASDEERTQNYARILTAVTEVTYPTAALAARVERAPQDGLRPFATFVANNPDFDIVATPIRRFVSQKGEGVLAGIEDPVAFVNRVAALQRVNKYTLQPRQALALTAAGIGSALDIYKLGAEAFTGQFAAAVGDIAPAQLTFAQAEHSLAYSMALVTAHHAWFNQATPHVIAGPISPEVADDGAIPAGVRATLRTLFGSLDFCQCEHCRSIYSPAAYLADCLQFLSECRPLAETDPASTYSLLDALRERRPDLVGIELNCANTHTPLPYIDLVNEVLEDAVAPKTLTLVGANPDLPAINESNRQQTHEPSETLRQLLGTQEIELPPTAYLTLSGDGWTVHAGALCYRIRRHGDGIDVTPIPQTTRSAEHLCAAPEHLHAPAYGEPLIAAHFPPTLPFDLALETIRVFLTHLGTSRLGVMRAFAGEGVPSADAVAHEELGLSGVEAAIVVEPAGSGFLYYGLTGEAELRAFARGHVAAILERAAISYNDLLQLIDTDFVNPGRRVGLHSLEATCDLTKVTLSGAERDRLNLLQRLHRFMRLKRRLAWPISELDGAIAALGTRQEGALVLDLGTLRRLAVLHGLRSRLRVPFDELLTLWADLDTGREGSLYQRLFLNPTVVDPVDQSFAVARLADPAAPLAGHETTVLAALRLTASDLAAIQAEVAGADRISSPSLSILCRHSVLARALGISVIELLILRRLIEADPFATGDPSGTVTFIDQIEEIRAAGFTIAELAYLVFDPISADVPGALREYIARVSDALRPGEEEVAAVGRMLVAESPPASNFGSIPAAAASSPEDLRSLLMELGFAEDAIDTAIAFLQTAQLDEPGSRRVVDRLFGTFIPHESAYENLLDTDELTHPESEKLEFVAASARKAKSKQLMVQQSVSGALSLDRTVGGDLLERLPAVVDSDLPTRFDFLGEFVGDAPVPVHTRVSFLRLHKVAVLVGRFRLSRDEIAHLSLKGLALDLLSAANEPPRSAPSRVFAQWSLIRGYARLRDSLPRTNTRLIDVFMTETDDAAREKLVLLTGWKREEIESAAIAQIRTVAGLEQLQKQISLVQRTGAGISALRAWASEVPTLEHARQIRETVKSQYAEKDWLKVTETLEDGLRERRRDALVAYLTHNPRLWRREADSHGDSHANANALYAHFLVDVEMSACQLTSRIRQAIAAVQLFVQRCLLGLETRAGTGQRLAVSPEKREQWETWRKLYRVWEGNRKVLLYAENWIRPELRDDKSPFFQEVENALLQNEVTDETVEAAYLRYLEQLSEVARLDIVGLHAERDGATDVVHVFGRTPGTPHRYFYRRFVDSSYWTAWERVELDIEGDHLIPIAWNRRLYLFWPIVVEKAVEQQAPIHEGPGQPPQRYWEVRFAFSEYKNGQWSPKKTSEEYHRHAHSEEFPSPSSISFRIATGDRPTIALFYPLTSEEQRLLSATEYPANAAGVYIFYFDDCMGSFKAIQNAGAFPFYYYPSSTTAHGNRFVEVGDHVLSLPERSPAADAPNQVSTLNRTPGIFRLCFPASGRQVDGIRQPFFFQDEQRVFFVQKEVPPELATAIPSERLPRLIEEQRYGRFHPRIEFDAGQRLEPLLDRAVTLAGRGVSALAAAGSEPHLLLSLLGFPGIVRLLLPEADKRYVFRPHYHPFNCLFLEQLNREGLAGLLDPAPVRGPVAAGDRNLLRRQRIRGSQSFSDRYDPNRDVVAPQRLDPIEEIEFDEDGAYSLYNWELFFHIPLMVADRLMQNQRFAEAQKWLHYIFDPTIGFDPSVDARLRDGPARFWKIRPFFEVSDAQRTVEQLMRALNTGDADLERLVARWENDPFNPHLVARLRPVAYMKATVKMYLDNCLAWADDLFSQDTQESVAEATQLYLLAADILGPRPNIVPPRGEPAARTYEGLEGLLDDFSNAMLRIEEEVPAFSYPVGRSRGALPRALHFCVPPNDRLFDYWDKVADRLFKIRHCLNIEGVFRQLALFEPPIDPALLVRARALGVDLREVLAGDVPLGPYRFQTLMQLAKELCSDVRALGAALLSAIERKDAEALSRLRSEQEIRLLDAIQDIRDKQVEEAKRARESLLEAKEMTATRYSFYSSRSFMNDWESVAIALTGASGALQLVANIIDVTGGSTSLIPDVTVGVSGWAGSPVTTVKYGGTNASNSAQSWSRAFGAIASALGTLSSMSATLASYERRAEEWKLQEDLAHRELKQIDKQIAAAELRLHIAEKEQDNHKRQREHARTVDEFMREKFSNQELFAWMEQETASIYFQSYRLALDLARRAERALRFERGLEDDHPAIVRTGQWDSLRRGLLAGEKLQFDLRRLEMAWLDENRRELEITKHISLAQLNPGALVALRSIGECEFRIPEVLFDLDFPGHYFRRIKSVNLTLPSIVGPYTGVNCTLTFAQL